MTQAVSGETTHRPKHGDVRPVPPGAEVYLDGRDEDGVQVAPEGWYEIGCRVEGGGER